MNRRSFFQLIAGAMLAPALPVLSGEIFTGPLLWGDGVHDDTEALNALFRGETVEFVDLAMSEGAGWLDAETLLMPCGNFRLTDSLVVKNETGKPVQLFANGSKIIGDHDGVVVHLEGSAMTLYDWHIEMSRHSSCGVYVRGSIAPGISGLDQNLSGMAQIPSYPKVPA